MNLIYKEYIKFLRDVTGKELADIKEGYFWLDKQIIKGFDKYGNIHKFYRVVISNDLSTVELRKLKDYDNVEDVDLASWQDLIEMKKEHLKQIESEAIIYQRKNEGISRIYINHSRINGKRFDVDMLSG